MKLFYDAMSPACRAILLTMKAYDINLELEEIESYNKGADVCEELLKINPKNTVPTLIDNENILRDTYEILKYLAENHSSEESFYPKNSSKREAIDDKFQFDYKTLHPRIDDILKSIVVEDEKEIPTDKISAITEAYKLLDTFLNHQTYLTGDCITLADFCCVATVTTATIITPISTERYPNLSAWYRTLKNLPFYEEANGTGLNKLDALVELKLGRPRTKGLCE